MVRDYLTLSSLIKQPPRSTPEQEAQANEPVVSCTRYVNGVKVADIRDFAQGLQACEDEGGFIWLGLCDPSAEQLQSIAESFHLPPLAVEDALVARQRPKLEHYPGVTFAVVKPVRYVDENELVEVSELFIFLGENFVITVRHGISTVPARTRADLEGKPDVLKHGPSVVLYRSIDIAVDDYLDVVGAIGIDIDDIEVEVFSEPRINHSERIYSLKREVLEFRRAAAPLVLPLEKLAEQAVWGVPRDSRFYFRDVRDHLLRVADAVDSYDRLLTDALQADLAQAQVQQNEDMRKISAWAAIGLVPTAIAGIYGMNFDNMPELRMQYGYYGVLVAIATVCFSLYLIFRKNKWL